MPTKLKKYCFTFFPEDHVYPVFDERYHQYLIIGEETCPTSKKIHYQCYVEFLNTPKTCEAKDATLGLNKPAHWEAINGSTEANINYCKGDTPVKLALNNGKLNYFEEYGTPMKKGQRTDLKTLITKLRLKEITPEQAMEEAPDVWARSHNACQIAYNSKKPPKQRNCRATYVYGLPGRGKTEWAMENFPKPFHCTSQDVYYRGYDEHETIVVDEVVPGSVKFTDWNRIMSNVDCTLPTFYGRTPCFATHVVFISNYKLEEIMDAVPKSQQAQAEAWKSRFVAYKEIDGPDLRVKQPLVMEKIQVKIREKKEGEPLVLPLPQPTLLPI